MKKPVRISIRIDSNLAMRLDELGNAIHVTRSKIARYIITSYMDKVTDREGHIITDHEKQI
jgi:predicted transcriptional regulator